jgi:hypothetical protein
MSKEILQSLTATYVQAGMVYQFGEHTVLLTCNPFLNYADVRERVDHYFQARLKMAGICVAQNFKGTKAFEAAVCS